MSDLEPNAQEDKDVESVSDSPGRTQEPLQSHTFSLKNNAAGLSSDEHENPLNGTQPNPFVYSSVPAVPHAGNSLPSGALVNGPGSHPTSEVHCVLNKGAVLSNNVLDAAWQAEKDTSPEVLPPPSELQSDAWKNTAGPAAKTLATQPGVNTPPSHSEENESKLAHSTLSGADSAEQMHISQPLTKQTMETRSRRDVEWSESSSDDYDDAEAIRWDSASLHNDRRLETKVMHQRDRKHNTHVKSMSGSLEKVNHTCRRSCFCSRGDENVDIANKEDSSGTRYDIKYSAVPLKDLSRNRASDPERRIYSTAAQEGCNEENDPEDEDNFSSKVEHLKTEQIEQDPLFFSCTICNVNFKEERHFHRHMMYHLGKHNQVNSVSQPFICRECGRLFCDSNSLTRHIIIHQDRLEKLMEEIKGLKNTGAGDRGNAVQCSEISVQHAKTHDNLKHYYFCEECNYITLTQQALEAHIHVTHLSTRTPKYGKITNDAEEADQFQRKMGFFTSGDKEDIKRRSQCGNYKKFAKPNLLTLVETTHFPQCSSKKGNIYIQKSTVKTVNSPRFKCRVGCTKNTLSPSLWRVDRHGKLLLQPVEELNVASDLTCVEAENNDCEAFGSSKRANCPATADFLLSARNLKLEQMFCQGSENDPESGSLQANQNSLSMRDMSTPLHSTIDSMNGDKSARLSQRLQKQCADEELEKGCEGSDNLSDDAGEATGSFLESENAVKPFARRCLRKRQSFSARDQSPCALREEDDADEDCSDIEQLIIKEEFIETTVCDDSSESPRASASCDVFPTPAGDLKPCPYCPAMFESGVGLSNHVRGHLHRVGLSYNARHMVSPEQVALRDRQPRIRRRIPCSSKRVRKAVKPETQREHRCPLCWGWFDTKTGLSNHVRGHLRRIGRSVTSSSKSPLCILNELLQDKKEHQNILQVLNKSRFPSRSCVSQKFISGSGLLLMHMGIPVKIQYQMRSPRALFVPKQEAGAFSEKKNLQVEAQRDTKASSSTLVELLQMRQDSLELAARKRQEANAPRTLCDFTKDYKEETRKTKLEPDWTHGECDMNEICTQCDGTFPGHLRAYAYRKRIAIFEGDDYKQKKPRPRPGLKKKVLPSLNAEIYTLTCRFCDLVFQGPLSIQEDWIKHLQRHLLHTGVPHSGTAMVEVLGLHHKIQMSMSGEHIDLE
ncbi:zinc finger protein 644 [Plectropomus leopardus]|uniref:zinc finger protein 644 n=1 Tax=Plectropomus leopardus TaxID=160734 RepID=UPI001C4CAB21|nr:zinc finger protein 644 [Plectropomus leopardus]